MLSQFTIVPTCTGDERSIWLLLSRAPVSPSPQAQIVYCAGVNREVSAAGGLPPAETLAHTVSVPTCVGDDRLTVDEWSSSPLPASPHVHSVPSVLVAAA